MSCFTLYSSSLKSCHAKRRSGYGYQNLFWMLHIKKKQIRFSIPSWISVQQNGACHHLSQVVMSSDSLNWCTTKFITMLCHSGSCSCFIIQSTFCRSQNYMFAFSPSCNLFTWWRFGWTFQISMFSSIQILSYQQDVWSRDNDRCFT